MAEGDVFPGGVRVFNVGPQTDTSGSAPVGIRRHAPRSTAMDQRPDKRPRRHPETTARRDVAQGGRHPVTLPRMNDSMVVAGPLLDGRCRRWKSGFLSSGHPTDSRPASALVEQLRSMQKGVDDRQPVHLLAVLQILAERLAEVIDIAGNSWRYGYDAAGRLASHEDPTAWRFTIDMIVKAVAWRRGVTAEVSCPPASCLTTRRSSPTVVQ